jgi:hypothetical protein
VSKLILDPSENNPVQPAFDAYWDKPMTRREAHTLFMKLAANDSELMGMADTAALLINYICEKKLGITDRTDVDAYVLVKKEQLQARREAMKKAAAAGQDPEVLNPGPEQGQAQDAQPNV